MPSLKALQTMMPQSLPSLILENVVEETLKLTYSMQIISLNETKISMPVSFSEYSGF